MTGSERGPSAPGRAGSPTDVVACVLRDGRGRLLVGCRPAGKRHAGLWEFPGGKVRRGESLAQAAARELEEELGLTGIETDGAVIHERMDPGSDFRILFVGVRTDQTPRALEHDRLAWIDPSDHELELAPADASFVEAVAMERLPIDRPDDG